MLVKKQTVTLQHPSELDSWVKVRVPLAAGDMEQLGFDGSRVTITFGLMSSVIVEWSEPDPITLDTIRQLDLDTFNWLTTEIFKASGIRDDAEKKDSVSESAPITSQTELSPASSAT